MSIYNFVCNKCGYEFEKSMKMSELNELIINNLPLSICPKCDSINVKRSYSPPSISFKGSGFYVNDYKKK
jgi:putative FmdB family regulatory protein